MSVHATRMTTRKCGAKHQISMMFLGRPARAHQLTSSAVHARVEALLRFPHDNCCISEIFHFGKHCSRPKNWSWDRPEPPDLHNHMLKLFIGADGLKASSKSLWWIKSASFLVPIFRVAQWG
mmetsp:Transcript_55196/g.115459  ORF Transcript_55196/g.115459 Transcript_55196/m.115459 type:complete len:122 (+) Transcript_55196:555-920(+)